MAALTFTLTSAPPERCDLSPLTALGLAGKSRTEIEKIAIGTSRHGLLVGDIFRVSGGEVTEIEFTDGSERFDRIGQNNKDGQIRVGGDVGAYLGQGMLSGSLTVEGNVVGPYLGTAMKGGKVLVQGNAADAVGGAIPGAMQGMGGGLIAIAGSAGDYIGDRMRRGVIAIGGAAGIAAGARMIGGTILAGSLGRRAGQSMKRGTLVAGSVEDIEPTFVPAGRYDAVFLSLLSRWLQEEAGEEAADLVPAAAMRFRGDMAALGKGEMLVGI